MQTNKINKKESGAKRIITLLIQNELGFARLYQKFARIYDDADFWLELAQQEKRHAQWLKTIFESRDVTHLSNTFLSRTTVLMMVRVIEEEIVSKQSISLKEALEKSLKYEKSFIENNFFEVFEADAPTARKVFADLKIETLGHINFIKSEISRIT